MFLVAYRTEQGTWDRTNVSVSFTTRDWQSTRFEWNEEMLREINKNYDCKNSRLDTYIHTYIHTYTNIYIHTYNFFHPRFLMYYLKSKFNPLCHGSYVTICSLFPHTVIMYFPSFSLITSLYNTKCLMVYMRLAVSCLKCETFLNLFEMFIVLKLFVLMFMHN